MSSTKNKDLDWSGMESWLVSEALPRIVQAVDQFNSTNSHGLVALISDASSSAKRNLFTHLPMTESTSQVRRFGYADIAAIPIGVLSLRDEELAASGDLLTEILSFRWENDKRLWQGTRNRQFGEHGYLSQHSVADIMFLQALLSPDQNQWIKA